MLYQLLTLYISIFNVLSLQFINDYILNLSLSESQKVMVKQHKNIILNESQAQSVSDSSNLNGSKAKSQVSQKKQSKKQSLTPNQEYDELRIIKQFQIKRKLLMKALKWKQKNKSQRLSHHNDAQIKEGMREPYFRQKKTYQQGMKTINESHTLSSQSTSLNSENIFRISYQQNDGQSNKRTVGIQTYFQIPKTKRIQKYQQRFNEKELKPRGIQRIAQQIKPKRVRTLQDLQKIKNQLTTTLGIQQEEKPKISKKLHESRLKYPEVEKESLDIIQRINNDIENYYDNRLLRKRILEIFYLQENQNKRFFNKYNLIKPVNQQLSHTMLTDKNLFNKSQQITTNKLNNNFHIKVNPGFTQYKLPTKDKYTIEKTSQKKPKQLQRIKLDIQPLNNINIQIKQSSQYANKIRPIKPAPQTTRQKRKDLNERFQIALQQKTLQSKSKHQTNLTHQNNMNIKNEYKTDEKHEKHSRLNQKYKYIDSIPKSQNQFQPLGKYFESQDFFKKQQDSESTQFSPLDEWITQFNKQCYVICQKFNYMKNDIKLYRDKKNMHKLQQLQTIQTYCNKKKNKFIQNNQQIKKYYKKNTPQKCSFKQKIKKISKQNKLKDKQKIKQKDMSQSQWSSSSQQFDDQLLNYNPTPLKQIHISQKEQQQFGKSIDLGGKNTRKRRNKLFKQIIQSDSNLDSNLDSQIYSNTQSHLDSHSSYSLAGFQSAKSQKEFLPLSKKSNESFAFTISNYIEEKNKIKPEKENKIDASTSEQPKKSNDWSFFQSQQGIQYFNMERNIF